MEKEFGVCDGSLSNPIITDTTERGPYLNRSESSEKWSTHRLSNLLRYYGAHTCLWNPRDIDFRSQKMRRAALIDITAALGDGIEQIEVERKINMLRSTYRYERRRIKKRIQRGIGAQTELKWFALADSFLRPSPRKKKTIHRHGKKDDHKIEENSEIEKKFCFTVDPEHVLPLQEEAGSYSRQLKIDPSEVVTTMLNQNEAMDSAANIKTRDIHIRKWTNEDSLRLVHLIGQHPNLWHNELNSLTESMHATVVSIAESMQFPKEKILKRINIFQRTCERELLEIQNNNNYKPSFVWWELAERFMSQPIHDQLTCFIDPSELPPPTPYDCSSCINPIPSVIMHMGDFDEREATIPHKPLLTHVVNGLEDDLLEGKWSLKHSVKFLRLYGSHRCLWDLRDPDYRSRELRGAAIADIAAAMGHGLTEEYVAKKIKIFRITYMQHRKRMLAASKSGRQPDIQLRWFPLADSFLRPHIGLRCIREDEQEMPQFDFQYVYANLNLIDPALLNDFRGKGTQNMIEIGAVDTDGRDQTATTMVEAIED